MLAVHLEDRYPRCVNLTRAEVALDEDPTTTFVEAQQPGAIAFVFGRTATGRSVCVRVEGVRPRLFFSLEGTTKQALRQTLEREVHTALHVECRSMAHMYGYEPDPTSPSGRLVHEYAEVFYPSLRTFRAACSLRKDDPAREPMAHETFVNPTTRFLLEHRISPGGWVRVSSCDQVDLRATTCDDEVLAERFEPLPEVKINSPYRVLYYDIETLGLDPKLTQVVQVGFTSVCGGVATKLLVAVGTVAPLDGVQVFSCATESELLRTVRQVILREDPDFVVAYNGVNFDASFLCTRAELLGVGSFFKTSRFATRDASLRELSLSSSGMGDNVLRYQEMHGRVTLDWFIKLKRDLTSEPKYSLQHFARKFCDDQKEDMDYREIPVLQAGSAQDRARLGSYCVHDTYLLHLLDEKRAMIVEILQFAVIMGIPPEWVYFRGQQVRFVTQLLAKARTAEAVPLLLNRPTEGFSGEGVDSFEGATVNDPKVGFYKTHPVIVLDWKSLYPSIMLAHNLCMSTWVPHAPLFRLEGVQEHCVRDDFVTHFATASRHRGILPLIIEELLEQRALAKKEVKRHLTLAKAAPFDSADQRMHSLLAKVNDGRQLALKVSCNSVYGACGATVAGKYFCLAVSATVTYQGRQAMVIKKSILPCRFPGVDVVYGDTDSVMLTFQDVTDVQAAGVRGEEAAQYTTDHFASLGFPAMQLEFEKAYFPYALLKKKRYFGLKYEPEGSTMVCKGIDAKGVETERRDTLPFLKEVMIDVREALLVQRDDELALTRLDAHLARLVRNEVPFEQLVLRKNLSSKVEDKVDSIAHARVNALRRRRDPGSEERVGNQVEYVILRGHRSQKTTELAEDPAYAKEHRLPLNLLWYFEHQIEKPLRSMLDGIDSKLDDRFTVLRAELDRERLGIARLESGSGTSVRDVDVPVPRPIQTVARGRKRVKK